MSTISPGPEAHEITPSDAYQIDSDEFESEDEGDMIPDEEYDQLMEEGMFHSTTPRLLI